MNNENDDEELNGFDPEEKDLEEANNSSIQKEMNRRLFVSLLTGGVAAIAGYGSWKWIVSSPKIDEIPGVLRKNHEFNENLSRSYTNPSRMAPEFSKTKAEEPRANGDIGLNEDFDPSDWKLIVINENGISKNYNIEDIKKLPSVEMTTELKCIEGWSTIVNWKGTKLFDFLMKNRLITQNAKYIGMETPDGEYYVGLDIESAIHPQTLLAYEMNGQSLSLEHGAPLRLVTPLKYGIKHIKRIGTIKISTKERPKDYWAEQGYDWYSGH